MAKPAAKRETSNRKQAECAKHRSRHNHEDTKARRNHKEAKRVGRWPNITTSSCFLCVFESLWLRWTADRSGSAGLAAAKVVEDLLGHGLEGLEDTHPLDGDGLEGGLALEVKGAVHLVHRHCGWEVAFVELED